MLRAQLTLLYVPGHQARLSESQLIISQLFLPMIEATPTHQDSTRPHASYAIISVFASYVNDRRHSTNPVAATQLSTCRKGARGKPGRTKTQKNDRNKRIQKKMLSSSHSKVPPPSFLSLLPSRSFRQYRPMPSMPCHTIPCHTKPFSQGRRGDAPVPERRKAKQPPSLLARSMPFQGRTPPCLLPILPSLLHQTPSIHSSMLNPPAQNAM